VPQYLHIVLSPAGAVHIGSSVELKLIISQVGQERFWVKVYTQVIRRNRTVNSTVYLEDLQPVIVFGYICNLQMTDMGDAYKI